jgi:hypothetical protein
VCSAGFQHAVQILCAVILEVLFMSRDLQSGSPRRGITVLALLLLMIVVIVAAVFLLRYLRASGA